MDSVAAQVEVWVEVPRGGLLKRDHLGHIDYVSPMPSPFNYGSVPGVIAEDGAPQDVILLGPRLPRGHRGRWPVLGVVRFVDGGLCDDKLVCGKGVLTPGRRLALATFFRVYARFKRLLNRARGIGGETTFGGVEARSAR